MSVAGVLIRISTGEILKHDNLPVADPATQEVEGLDPDLKWLIKHEPFGAPLYDSRVFILQKTEEVTEEPHPDFPLYDQYRITYATDRRVVDEVKQAVINAEREQFNRHVDHAVKLLALSVGVLFQEITGLTLNARQQAVKNRALRLANKVWLNDQRRRQLEAEAESLQPVDIDAGWVDPDDEDPV